MRLISSISPKTVHEEEWDTAIQIISWMEIFAMALSMVPITTVSILNTSRRIFHWNANVIIMVYTAQYFLSCASRFILILNQINENSIDSNIVTVANYSRTGCHFLSFFVLPVLLFERCLATVYSVDYEKRLRLWIPVVAVGGLLFLTIFSTYLFANEYVALLPTLLTITMVNTLGFVGLMLNQRYNLKLHRSNTNAAHGSSYSLSERFQIAENIKTSEILAKLQFLIFLFTIACSTTLVLDFFDANSKILLVAYTFFNFICIGYGFLIPIVCVLNVQIWRRDLQQFIQRFFLCQKVASSATHLKTTTGEKISFNPAQQADIYFQQFQNQISDSARGPSSLISVK